MGHILYVTYDGLTDHLGASQIWPYIRGLSRRGWHFTVVSFEKTGASAAERALVQEQMEQEGVRWIPLRYHKTPAVPATLLDIAIGTGGGLLGAARTPISLVHSRSFVAATMAQTVAKIAGIPHVFDMRGFWADEKLEEGSWGPGIVYRSVKAQERKMLENAAAVVSLTEAGLREMRSWPAMRGERPPIAVIPTCVDLERFLPEFRAELPASPLRFGYLGSLSGRYMMDEVIFLFAQLRRRRPEATLDVFSRDDPRRIWQSADQHGLPRDAISVRSLTSQEVPAALSGLAATFSLIKPGYSSLASCPTKMAESLAVGTPVVVNPGIGDCAELAEQHRCGIKTLLNHQELEHAADRLLALLDDREHRNRSRALAQDWFGLDAGIDRYDALYQEVLENASPASVRSRSDLPAP